MIIDTSAILALLFREPGWEEIAEKLASGQSLGIGAPTLVESAIVLSARMGSDARGILSRFISETSVSVIPFGEAHYSNAVEAWLRYGKGRHRASLNFGDCVSYAMAKVANEELLCTGNDFTKTDLSLA